MSQVSLTAAMNGVCRFTAGNANRLQSDRQLFNTNEMLCPVWNGSDSAGRRGICANSFKTLSAGCDSPLRRTLIENALRPKYFEFITLNARGLEGNTPVGVTAENVNEASQCNRSTWAQQTGNFGLSEVANTTCGSCNMHPMTSAMANHHSVDREIQHASRAYDAYHYKSCR
jgi:hypothetical protein